MTRWIYFADSIINISTIHLFWKEEKSEENDMPFHLWASGRDGMIRGESFLTEDEMCARFGYLMSALDAS